MHPSVVHFAMRIGQDTRTIHRTMERRPPNVKLTHQVARGRRLMTSSRLQFVARDNELLRTLMDKGVEDELGGTDENAMKTLGYYLVRFAHHNVSQGSECPLSARVDRWWQNRLAEGDLDFSDIVYDLFREAGAALE